MARKLSDNEARAFAEALIISQSSAINPDAHHLLKEVWDRGTDAPDVMVWDETQRSPGEDHPV